MYSVAIAVAAGVAFFLMLTLTGLLSWWASLLPATLLAGGLMFAIARRVNALVSVEVAGITPLLQSRDVEGAQSLIRSIQARYGRWQIALEGQLEAQLGVIDYMQGKWDDALPRLEKGSWRNSHALMLIACIRFRRGDKEGAWASFDKAVDADAKESMAYLVHAVLRANAGDREGALIVLGKGLEALPAHAALEKLQSTLANKKKVDTKQLPQTWYNFFPEDAMKQQVVVRGMKGPPPPGVPQPPQPRFGARSAPRR
jgi:hypothetical protein